MIATIDTSADVLVRLVRASHRRQAWLSVAGLVLILVVATAYLLIGALRLAPLATSYRISVHLPESGGLLPNQDVALRGVRIGKGRVAADHRPGRQRNRQHHVEGEYPLRQPSRTFPRCLRQVSSSSTSKPHPTPGRICMTAASSPWIGPPSPSTWRNCSRAPTGCWRR